MPRPKAPPKRKVIRAVHFFIPAHADSQGVEHDHTTRVKYRWDGVLERMYRRKHGHIVSCIERDADTNEVLTCIRVPLIRAKDWFLEEGTQTPLGIITVPPKPKRVREEKKAELPPEDVEPEDIPEDDSSDESED